MIEANLFTEIPLFSYPTLIIDRVFTPELQMLLTHVISGRIWFAQTFFSFLFKFYKTLFNLYTCTPADMVPCCFNISAFVAKFMSIYKGFLIETFGWTCGGDKHCLAEHLGREDLVQSSSVWIRLNSCAVWLCFGFI